MISDQGKTALEGVWEESLLEGYVASGTLDWECMSILDNVLAHRDVERLAFKKPASLCFWPDSGHTKLIK